MTMKNKKVTIAAVVGALVLVLLAVIFIPKLIKDEPAAPPNVETSSTQSAWMDEEYCRQEPLTENEEHTLPLVTVA